MPFSEKIVPDLVHLKRTVVSFPNHRAKLFHIRCSESSGCQRQDAMQGCIHLHRLYFRLYFLIEQAQHTNAVFQLQITVIPFFFRKRAICQQIPFIRCMDEMYTMNRINLFLPCFNRTRSLLQPKPHQTVPADISHPCTSKDRPARQIPT